MNIVAIYFWKKWFAIEVCEKCGRKLKSSKSKEVGYGPICYKKLFGSKVKIRNKSVSKSTYKFNLNDMPGQMSIDDFISTSEK